MTRQGVGQAGAALHRAANGDQHLGQPLVGGVLRGHGQHAIERQPGLEQRGDIPRPQGDGGTAPDQPAHAPFARGGGLDRDRDELLMAKLVDDLLAGGRLDDPFEDLALRGGGAIAVAIAHGATSSRVTRNTSSTVVTPAAALA